MVAETTTKSPFLGIECPHIKCPSMEVSITEGLTTMYMFMYKLSTCSIHKAIFVYKLNLLQVIIIL